MFAQRQLGSDRYSGSSLLNAVCLKLEQRRPPSCGVRWRIPSLRSSRVGRCIAGTSSAASGDTSTLACPVGADGLVGMARSRRSRSRIGRPTGSSSDSGSWSGRSRRIAAPGRSRGTLQSGVGAIPAACSGRSACCCRRRWHTCRSLPPEGRSKSTTRSVELASPAAPAARRGAAPLSCAQRRCLSARHGARAPTLPPAPPPS